MILNTIGKKIGLQIQKGLLGATVFDLKSKIDSVAGGSGLERKETTLSEILKPVV